MYIEEFEGKKVTVVVKDYAKRVGDIDPEDVPGAECDPNMGSYVFEPESIPYLSVFCAWFALEEKIGADEEEDGDREEDDRSISLYVNFDVDARGCIRNITYDAQVFGGEDPGDFDPEVCIFGKTKREIIAFFKKLTAVKA